MKNKGNTQTNAIPFEQIENGERLTTWLIFHPLLSKRVKKILFQHHHFDTSSLSAPLRKILQNIVGTRKKGPVFEQIPAEQTMNKYLKDIAAIAEIDKSITHKVGRLHSPRFS